MCVYGIERRLKWWSLVNSRKSGDESREVYGVRFGGFIDFDEKFVGCFDCNGKCLEGFK